jgi:NarL family two-component system response regulator YdfI
MDLAATELGNLDCLLRLKDLAPNVPVIVLSVRRERNAVLRSLKLGAHGHLVKPVELEVLIEAVCRAVANSVFLCSRAQQLLVEVATRPTSSGGARLSDRENDVVALLARRLTEKEIALALSIAPRTVNAHTTSIYHKLGVHSWRDAVAGYLTQS